MLTIIRFIMAELIGNKVRSDVFKEIHPLRYILLLIAYTYLTSNSKFRNDSYRGIR